MIVIGPIMVVACLILKDADATTPAPQRVAVDSEGNALAQRDAVGKYETVEMTDYGKDLEPYREFTMPDIEGGTQLACDSEAYFVSAVFYDQIKKDNSSDSRWS